MIHRVIAAFAVAFSLLTAAAPAQTPYSPSRAEAEELAQVWMVGAGLRWRQVMELVVDSAIGGPVFGSDRGLERRGELSERFADWRDGQLQRTATLRLEIQAYPDPPDLARIYREESQTASAEIRRAQAVLDAVRSQQLAVLDQIDAAAVAKEEMQQQIFQGEMSVMAAIRAGVMMQMRPLQTITHEVVLGTSLFLPEGSPLELSLRASTLGQEAEAIRTPLFVAVLRGRPADIAAAQRELSGVAVRARRLAGEMREAESYPLTYAANSEQRRQFARVHAYMPNAAVIMEQFASEVDAFAAELEGLTAAEIIDRDAWDAPPVPDFLSHMLEPAAMPL